MVTDSQLALLLVAILAYLTGGVASALQLAGKQISRTFQYLCMGIGIATSAGLLLIHSVTTGRWLPLQDNLSAMLTLAVLLAGFVAYVQIRRPVRSLEWLVMPVVTLLLLAAGHFGKTQPEPYTSTIYSLIHRISSFLGVLAFVVAGAAGTLYLVSDRMLRSRSGGNGHLFPPRPGVFGSLERLEHLSYSAVTLGFALFTVGIVTGIGWVLHGYTNPRAGEHWFLWPKVVLAFACWLVFAIVLHTPIAPRLRGRKNAILSIVGLLLAIASLFAVLVMPKGGA